MPATRVTSRSPSPSRRHPRRAASSVSVKCWAVYNQRRGPKARAGVVKATRSRWKKLARCSRRSVAATACTRSARASGATATIARSGRQRCARFRRATDTFEQTLSRAADRQEVPDDPEREAGRDEIGTGKQHQRRRRDQSQAVDHQPESMPFEVAPQRTTQDLDRAVRLDRSSGYTSRASTRPRSCHSSRCSAIDSDDPASVRALMRRTEAGGRTRPVAGPRRRSRSASASISRNRCTRRRKIPAGGSLRPAAARPAPRNTARSDPAPTGTRKTSIVSPVDRLFATIAPGDALRLTPCIDVPNIPA